ncbi:MAG: hypothetical protein MK193_03020 [Lentisphaeria bacterium]|nr:hypothetical protein [Lentisphaeria bacterium]
MKNIALKSVALSCVLMVTSCSKDAPKASAAEKESRVITESMRAEAYDKKLVRGSGEQVVRVVMGEPQKIEEFKSRGKSYYYENYYFFFDVDERGTIRRKGEELKLATPTVETYKGLVAKESTLAEVNQVFGEPTKKEKTKKGSDLFTYADGNAVTIKDGVLNTIKISTPEYQLSTGISVGDNLGKVFSTYGKQTKRAIQMLKKDGPYDAKWYLSYHEFGIFYTIEPVDEKRENDKIVKIELF